MLIKVCSFKSISSVFMVYEERHNAMATESNSQMAPLFTAIYTRNLEKVKELATADNINKIKQSSKSRYSALHFAIGLGYDEISKELIKLGADINLVYNGGTALHDAVKDRILWVVRSLIKFGANIEIKNSEGHTALSLAVLKDYIDIVLDLIKLGADITSIKSEAYKACKHKIFKKLIIAGINPQTCSGFSGFIDYVEKEAAEILEEYQKLGCEATLIKEFSFAPLDLKLKYYKNFEQTKWLALKAINELDKNALIRAINKDTVDSLILKAKLNDSGDSILHIVIKKYRDVRQDVDSAQILDDMIKLVIEEYPKAIILENKAKISAIELAATDSFEALKILINFAYQEFKLN